MVLRTVLEGKALIKADIGKISKRLAVFYNPEMKLNRDTTIIFLRSLGKKLRIGLALSGTGIRGLRLLLEGHCVKQLFFNDMNRRAILAIKRGLALNGFKEGRRIKLSCEDASTFLLSRRGFDYVDIDPFGSPNPFLDAAVRALSRRAWLGITATDTACLAGTYPATCRRKYWAVPLKCGAMHELGLRILIRKAQLVGSQYGIALMPLFSYAMKHYFRIIFECVRSKKATDKVLLNHGFILRCSRCGKIETAKSRKKCCKTEMDLAGPMWIGALWHLQSVMAMLKELKRMEWLSADKELVAFMQTIRDEAKIESVGFYDLHELSRLCGAAQTPKRDFVISKLRARGYDASRTHFKPEGIRSNAPFKTVISFFSK